MTNDRLIHKVKLKKYIWLNCCDESVQVPWKGFVADHEPISQEGQEEQVQGKPGTLSQH